MDRLQPLSDEERLALRRTIGRRCRQARLRLGLSQRALAAKMGRSSSWVREVERGDQFAPPYLTTALASATGVSVGWLYGEDEADLRGLLLRLLRALEPLE